MMELDVAAAVIARLAGDATLVALLSGGTAGIGSPQMLPRSQTQYPYISVNVPPPLVADGFTMNAFDVLFEVHVYSDSDAGIAQGDSIIKRVYGDGSRSPTYGLHRWTPSSAIGTSPYNFTASVVYRTDGDDLRESEHYQWIERYRLILSRSTT